ncbi:MAG: NAD-dependent epimerase/dehydratase family protein, partial [Calditrichaeota bacterium]
MSREELHVILGTGPLGLAVMEVLHGRDKRVKMVNHSGNATVPAGVEVARADLTQPDSARQVCEGATVVYFCAKPPYTQWPEKFPALLAGSLAGAASAGARLVYADNLYAYGPVDGPLTEDLPAQASGRKGRVRAQMAAMLLEAHRKGEVQVVIGRASDFFGPGVIESAVGEKVFGAALAGQTARVLGNPDLPHTYTFIGDFARALVLLGERDEAVGEVWHVPSAETLTTRQFVEMIYREAGNPPRLQAAPSWLIGLMAWFNPIMRELKEML